MAICTLRPRRTGLILLVLNRLLQQSRQCRWFLHLLLLTFLDLLPRLNRTLTPHTLTHHRPTCRRPHRHHVPPDRALAIRNTPTPLLPRPLPNPLLPNPRRLRRDELAIYACSDAPSLFLCNPASPALDTAEIPFVNKCLVHATRLLLLGRIRPDLFDDLIPAKHNNRDAYSDAAGNQELWAR